MKKLFVLCIAIMVLSFAAASEAKAQNIQVLLPGRASVLG